MNKNDDVGGRMTSSDCIRN